MTLKCLLLGSRNVLEHTLVVFITLNEVPLDQVLNPVLDLDRVRLKTCLQQLGGLNDQVLVFNSPPRLHNLHNTGLDGEPAIIFYLVLDFGAICLPGVLRDKDSDPIPHHVRLVIQIQ